MMDHDSLIQLLPQLLNNGASKVVTAEAEAGRQASCWYEGQVCSDKGSTQTNSDSEQLSETSSDQEDESDGSDQDEEDREKQGRISPKPVNLDEIEKFLEGITKPNTPRQAARSHRDMANILKEVNELGRRTLSSGSLLGGGGGGRPPPSPRRRPEACSPAAAAASESALLKEGDLARRVHLSRTQPPASGDEPAPLAPHSGGGGKLSVSEPALGYTLQSLMSEEKKRYLNLTADMILLKQTNLEKEIQMKTQWDEHLRDLIAENSSLKLEMEKLRTQPPSAIQEKLSERTRIKSLVHQVEEQNRLLDGFNAENARLYRELKQLKTDRADLETTVDDLQCEQRLLRARLEAAQRVPAPPPSADVRQEQEQGRQVQQEQERLLRRRDLELERRELELERRWQEVQRAGHEVARLHDLVTQRQSGGCVRCRSRGDGDSGGVRGELNGRVAHPQVASIACQTAIPPSPPRSPARSPAHSPVRSPEHVAAAATAELRSLRAALIQSEQRRDQELQATTVREAELRRSCDAKVRAAEGRLRRLQSSSPTRPDPELMAALRRLKAQLADKERALTQSRRQLEKSQRTVTGLQREREKLLVTIAARGPDGKGESRSRRGSPNRSQRASPSRSWRGSPVQRSPTMSAAAAVVDGRCVDETLLSELQTAIAAVEGENVLLKDQLGQMKLSRDEEVSRRDSQIASLRKENAEVRLKLGVPPSLSPSAGASGEEEVVLSARKDSLMLEMGSHMEAQEQVIVHLRETIRRFQEQTRLIAALEEENRTLRSTVDALHWQEESGRRHDDPDAAQEFNRS